ncbi:MAG TPA: ubiquitin-like small modifier protein 1 [Actinomycetota bacterium]|nr:ubiquitin-like small modifier protein 1 [Actinomycetota bacterium]
MVFELAGPLRQHAGGADAVEVDVPDGATVADALDALAKVHPAVERRVRDDEGRVRRHVNLFAGGELIRDASTSTALRPDARLVVLPAVSGGTTFPGRPSGGPAA